ncbi:hypothetical protein PG999_011983 [Apiospora kogelbergensis]|uniref:Uncharacterized protein n=1 Tax=Apiospora kogelbergensis TaxID=1337665 RepID=A0AAW0QPN7_9PEZI
MHSRSEIIRYVGIDQSPSRYAVDDVRTGFDMKQQRTGARDCFLLPGGTEARIIGYGQSVRLAEVRGFLRPMPLMGKRLAQPAKN